MYTKNGDFWENEALSKAKTIHMNSKKGPL